MALAPISSFVLYKLDAHIPKLLVVLLRLDKLSLHVQIFSKDSGCNVLDAILKLSLFQNV